MKQKDCRIGTEFQTAEGRLWRVTDVGRRTLAAIVIETPECTPPKGCEDPAWLLGPPYLVEEVLFDEKDIGSAFTSLEDAIHETLEDRYHPGFPGDVVSTMMKARIALRKGKPVYPFPRLLRIERWDALTQEVLHPYATEKTDNGWAVKVFRLFDRTFDQVPDPRFIQMPVARPTHFTTARKARAHPSHNMGQDHAPIAPVEDES